jgi:hypothetical protein
MKRHILSLALVGTVFAGCLPSLEVSEEVQISCESDDQCPQPLVCATAVNLCVTPQRASEEGPNLDGPPTVTPPVANLDTSVRIAFEVSKKLSKDPEVVLDTGLRMAPATLDEDATTRSDLHYEYTYLVDGSEAAGSRNFLITLQDEVGNLAPGLSGGSVELDFSAPVLVAWSLNPRTVPAAGSVTLNLTFNEALATDPTVTLQNGDTQIAMQTTSSNDTDFELTYAPQSGDPEGTYEVQVDAVDIAGNAMPTLILDPVQFDFTAPSIASSSVDPTVVRPGEVVRVVVDLDEAPGGTPTAVLVQNMTELAFEAPQVVGNRITFLHEAQDTEDGDFDVLVRGLEDEAGNALAEQNLGTVRVDGQAPVLVDYMQNGTTFLASDTLQVTFSTDEPLSVDPVVKLQDFELTKESGSDLGPYTFSLDLASTSLTGTWQVFVEVTDAVGNRAVYTPGTASLDSAPPELVGATFSPSSAKLNTVALLTLTVNEDLGDVLDPASVLSFDTDPGFAFASKTGVNYIFSLNVDNAVASGTYTLNGVSLTDLAGNNAVITMAESSHLPAVFSVDNAPPVLTACGTPPESAVMVGEEVVFNLTVGETIPEAPVVTLGDIVMTLDPTPLCTPGTGEVAYTYRYTPDGSEGQGAQAVVVQARDAAGNTTTETMDVVTFDFDAPTLLSTSAEPQTARQGQTIFYSVTASEPLAAPPTMTVSGAGTLSFTHQTGTTYTFAYTTTGAETDGTYAVSFGLEDAAGNTATESGTGFDIDVSVPTIASLAVDRTLYSDETNFDSVTVTFNTGEDVDAATLDVKIDGNDMSCAPYQSSTPNYTCTYTVAGTESEGSVPISVSVADAAGNSNFDSLITEFDFTAPTVGSATVQILPGTGNPLASPTRVTDQTTIRVRFVTSEDLSANPVVSTSTPASLGFTLVNANGRDYEYGYTHSGLGGTQGTYSVQAQVTDVVGNSATHGLTLPAPGFVLDTQAPSPPDVSTVDSIVYRRKPWGIDDTGTALDGVPQFTLEGQSGAVESNATAFAYFGGESSALADSTDVGTAQEIGSQKAASNGSFPAFQLNRADRQVVYVAAADEAGNLSDADGNASNGIQAAGVLDVQWTGSFGGKTTGNTLINPHVLRHSESFVENGTGRLAGAPRSRSDQVEAADYTVLDTVDGTSLSTDGNPRVMQRLTSDTAGPDPGWRTTDSVVEAVYDSIRGVYVFFAFGNDGEGGETWEWDGNDTWLQVCGPGTACTSPQGRVNFAMAFDKSTGETILFGGRAFNGPCEDGAGYPYRCTNTWGWNGSEWNLLCDPGSGCTSPNGQEYLSMAHSEARGRTVVFGGRQTATPSDELWEWDGMGWTQACGNGTTCSGPSARSEAAMAYDNKRDRIYLFGGRQNGGNCSGAPDSMCGDLWSWNGASWSNECTTCYSSGGPTPRKWAAMAYDATRDHLLLGGGEQGGGSLGGCGNYSDCDDLWRWNGSDWSQLCGSPTACTNIDTRVLHTMAFDSKRRRTLSFGYDFPAHQAWEWDGASWREACWEGGACPTNNHSEFAMAYHRTNDRVVTFGGYAFGDPYVNHANTWEWNGNRWDTVCSGGCTPPTARRDHAMAALTNSTLVMFGGYTSTYNDETWAWDGADWTQCSSTTCTTGGQHPDARRGHAMAQSGANEAVLFGGTDGTDFDDTWFISGTTWTQCNSTTCTTNGQHPSARTGHAMAYDNDRDVVVLFGGSAGASETWELSGTTWSMVCDTNAGCTGPGGRTDHAMAYDRLREKVILIGGDLASGDCGTGGTECNDVWEWDVAANSWNKVCGTGLDCEGVTETGFPGGAAYDVYRERTVYTAQMSSGSGNQETWEIGGGRWRPAHVAEFDLTSAGAPDAQDCRSDPTQCLFRDLAIDWTVGAVGGGADGATLGIWQGAWIPLEFNNALDTAPAAFNYTTEDLNLIGRAIEADQDPTLHVLVTPKNVNNTLTNFDKLVSDHVEVNLTYRRSSQFTSLLSDDFENGATPDAAVWQSVTGSAAITTESAHSGSYALNMNANTGVATTVAVDASNCWSVVWGIHGKRGPTQPGSTDAIEVEYFNGSGWVTAHTWSGGASDDFFNTRVRRISAAGAMHNAFQLRFVAAANAATDDFFLDDFRLVCAHD